MKSLDQLPIQAGTKVFVRVDFNVPFDSEGRIDDDYRIVRALPTIKYLLEKKAVTILASHQESNDGESQSLQPVAAHLGQLLGTTVTFVDFRKADETAKIAAGKPGSVFLLENVRVDKREKANDKGFAQELAKLADVYVNDAFGATHRKHTTTYALALEFKDHGVGKLIQDEIETLDKVIQSPERPFVAIMGGSKIADKVKVIEKLLPKVDKLLIGGGLAFAFHQALGRNIGKSISQPGAKEAAAAILAKAEKEYPGVLELPVDQYGTEKFGQTTPLHIVSADAIPDHLDCVDIGPRTIVKYCDIINNAKTVLWNGPVGAFEHGYPVGTTAIGYALVVATSRGASTIVGGGDSANAIQTLGLADDVGFVSTGGGASLTYLQGEPLPALDALK